MDEASAELERRLEALVRGVPRPEAGVFGTDSTFWSINRHAVIFLGAGRAALLQLAHPWVARAIEEHSNARADPFGRFRRTFFHVFRMAYGDLDTALRSARRVHALHATIQGVLPEGAGPYPAGSPYRALEPAALRWVHATLIDTTLRMYTRAVGPLDCDDCQRYYTDSTRFATLLGIPRERMPADWPAFARYVQGMYDSDVLTVTPAARSIAHALFEPRPVWIRPPLWLYRRYTASLLPARIRAGFGLPEPLPAEQRAFLGLERAIRTTQGCWPRHLRYTPSYVRALARLAVPPRRDPLAEKLERWLCEGSAKPENRERC